MATKKLKALGATRPSRKVNAVQEAQKLTYGKSTRLSVELHPDTHRALKVKAANAGMSIKMYILELLRQDGIPIPD